MNTIRTHTPGPWKYALDEKVQVIHVYSEDGRLNAGREIATVRGPDRRNNARLIAAAPELLALARVCVEYKAEGFQTAKVQWLASRAIAKAEGRT